MERVRERSKKEVDDVDVNILNWILVNKIR